METTEAYDSADPIESIHTLFTAEEPEENIGTPEMTVETGEPGPTDDDAEMS